MSKQSDKADKNTMVKKKRRSKFKFYFLNILLAVVILGVIFVFCSIFFLFISDFFFYLGKDNVFIN